MTDNQPVIEAGSDQASQKKSKTGSQKARKSAARLLAVQAVYQILSNKQSPEEVIPEFLEHRAGGIDIDGDELVTPDGPLFKDIVDGVFNHFDQLHEMVQANRGAKDEEKADKSAEPLLHSLFICGAFELMVHQSIDAPIIINDYLHAARAFYDDAEVKLVNAVLDGVRETTR